MLEVFVYNAGKGDCIRIHYAETHNIIIDSGVMRFSPNFKRICDSVIQNRETLDALTKISKNSPTSLGSEINCESESEHK